MHGDHIHTRNPKVLRQEQRARERGSERESARVREKEGGREGGGEGERDLLVQNFPQGTQKAASTVRHGLVKEQRINQDVLFWMGMNKTQTHASQPLHPSFSAVPRNRSTMHASVGAEKLLLLTLQLVLLLLSRDQRRLPLFQHLFLAPSRLHVFQDLHAGRKLSLVHLCLPVSPHTRLPPPRPSLPPSFLPSPPPPSLTWCSRILPTVTDPGPIFGERPTLDAGPMITFTHRQTTLVLNIITLV